MSKLLEFFLGSILITVFTIAFMFFSALHYVLKVSGIADCVWHGSAKAWIDANEDGLVNPGEPALRNVTVHIDDVQNRYIDVSWPAVTDKHGDVRFMAPIPGCAETAFEIYVDIPEGYRLITSPRIAVSGVNGDFWSSLGPENTYYFGFLPER